MMIKTKLFVLFRYNHSFISSPIIRRTSVCGIKECKPPPKPMVVTVTGATSAFGQVASLLLKQCPLIEELRLFDMFRGPHGIVEDLSHIDTNTKVRAFTGINTLKDAVTDARVVLVCGTLQHKPNQSEAELFKLNGHIVRTVALHTSEFNPKVVLCVAAPPLNALIPMVSEEYKKSETYDYRKILGVASISSVRANSIIACLAREDPCKMLCPIVGGLCSKSTVAVLSQSTTDGTLNSLLCDKAQETIAEAEDMVLCRKIVERSGPCYISHAFAASRFITSVVKALTGCQFSVECAYVKQIGHIGQFLPYMTSIVKLGKEGIDSIHMPKINSKECERLQKAASYIRKSIDRGECYITGAIPQKITRCKLVANPCPVMKVNYLSEIGDVKLTPDAE